MGEKYETTQQELEEAETLVEEHLTTIEQFEGDLSWYEEEYEGEKRDNLLVVEAENQIELMQNELVESKERILQLEEELEHHRNKNIEKILITPLEPPPSSVHSSENVLESTL